ncbi:MAG: MFS transporter [Chlamydiota bacterium]
MQPMNKNRPGWRLLALIGLGLSLLILNIDLMIVNLALPVIGQLFQANLSDLQWINNIYSLSMASTVIFIGSLADRYGHRLTFLSGITLFCFGSLVAGLAFSTAAIIIGRFFQGIGMAATFTMIFVLATLTFPKNQQGAIFGLLMIFTGIGMAVGPSLGGLMIAAFSWRWAFLINVPICLISYFAIWLACPKDREDSSKKIHYTSAFLLTALYFLILFALNNSQELSPRNFWVLFFAGMGGLAGFLVWQSRLRHPLVDITLFQNQIYSVVSSIRVLFQFSMGSFLFVLPLYLQNIEGFSVGLTGFIILALAAVLAIASPLSGRLSDRIGPEFSVLSSQICAVLGFGALVLMPIELSWPLLFFSLICVGANAGMALPATNYLVMREVPAAKKGLGFGTFTGMTFFFLSAGIAVTGYILNSISTRNFYRLIAASADATPDRAKIAPLINGAHSVDGLKELFLNQPDYAVFVGKSAFLSAFHFLMALLTGLSLAALVLSIFLLIRFRKAQEISTKECLPSRRS